MQQELKPFNRKLIISKGNELKIHLNIINPFFYRELIDFLKEHQKEKFRDLNNQERKIILDNLYFDDLS